MHCSNLSLIYIIERIAVLVYEYEYEYLFRPDSELIQCTKKVSQSVAIFIKANIMMTSSKNLIQCPIFGSINLMQQSKLPTNADVLRHLLTIKPENENRKNAKAFEEVAGKVIIIWKQACLPLIDPRSVQRKVSLLYDKYSKVLKSTSSKYFTSIKEDFENVNEQQLFDICSCKCTNIFECKCPYGFKVPRNEREFLVDQRDKRKMVFGQIDVSTTQKFEQKMMVRTKALTSESKIKRAMGVKPQALQRRKRISIETTVSLPPAKKIKLTNTAMALDRFSYSDRGAATVLNSFKKDLGIGFEDNMYDKNSIRRAKASVRKTAIKTQKSDLHQFIRDSKCYGLFFDGKKDATSIIETKNNCDNSTKHPRTMKEEHYTLIIEPKGNFYSHVSPTGSKAVDIYQSIVDKLTSDEFDLSKMAFIGSDGTIVNVGKYEGKFNKC